MISIYYLFETFFEFPTSRQEKSYSCGVAAVQTVLRYYGIEKKQSELSKELKLTSDGTDYDNMIKLFTKYNLKVEFGKMSLQDLRDFADKKQPTIILIQAYKEEPDKNYSKDNFKDGHYVVVIGYDDKNIIVEDPSLNNELGYIPFSELDTRWRGIGKTKDEKLVKFGMVIIGTPKFNPNKITKVKWLTQ